jgi:hypothetical protein
MPMGLTFRCERRGCPEAATRICSRIDAARDWLYLCWYHSTELASEPVWELSQLPLPAGMLSHLPQPQLSLEMTLAMWPPKHRTATKEDIRRGHMPARLLGGEGVV